MTTPVQPQQPASRRRGGLSVTTWVIIGLGIALAAGAYILYRRNQTASSATTTTTPDTTDLQGQIATLQGEIADLQSTSAQDESAEGGTSGTGGLQGGNPPTGTPVPVVVPRVVGDNWGKADNTIRRAGLIPAIKGQSATAHTNTKRIVTAQSPAPGKKVKAGSKVTVTLAKSGGGSRDNAAASAVHMTRAA